MIARKISENTAGKSQTAYAILHNAVTADFHESIFAAFCGHPSQQAVQCNRVGRGAFGGNDFAIYIITYCTAQSALMTQTTEYLIKQRCDGGFSICSCDTHQFHL